MKLELIDTQVFIPESSFSANYLHVNMTSGIIYIKNVNDLPKLIYNLDESLDKLMIIDKKFTFNVFSKLPLKKRDLLPSSKTEVIIKNVEINFVINHQVDLLGKFEKFCITIKAAKEGDIYHFRIDEWKKIDRKHNCVVVLKPSMKFDIINAFVSTNIVNTLYKL